MDPLQQRLQALLEGLRLYCYQVERNRISQQLEKLEQERRQQGLPPLDFSYD